MNDYGLPTPKSLSNELELEKTRYDEDKQRELFEHLQAVQPLNGEQTHVFEQIKNIVMQHHSDKIAGLSPSSKYIFLQAPGGTGKTTIANRLCAYFRAQGLLGMICCATTLACNNYDHAMTAHSLFKFPVIEDSQRDYENPPTCKLTKTDRLTLLHQLDFNIWDEAVSNNKEIFNEITDKKYEINMVYILMGDNHQVLKLFNLTIIFKNLLY
jgi:signal recognition particle GTPase